MPTVEEVNAGFDAVMPDMEQMASAYVPTIFGYRDKVLNGLHNDAAVRAIIVDAVRKVLLAAEHARADKPPPAPVPTASLVQYLKGE